MRHLNDAGRDDLILVDDFGRADREHHLEGRGFRQNVERVELADYLAAAPEGITAVLHLGAHTDTAEHDEALFTEHNLLPSQLLWEFCSREQIPLIYASSASTYGDGVLGYNDDAVLTRLRPLNAYGRSKHEFDLWVARQSAAPPFWAGLKFFNVYGPHEEHKHRMASVVLQAFQQIQRGGTLRLFKSHKAGIGDGQQARDFVYVDDVCEVIIWLLEHRPASGIYNLGTGTARTFEDLGLAVFAALGKPPRIEFVPTPEDIRAAYQYFTEAEMSKLRAAGYRRPFTTLEEGVAAYVNDYLLAKVPC